jgi:hypothetical protein
VDPIPRCPSESLADECLDFVRRNHSLAELARRQGSTDTIFTARLSAASVGEGRKLSIDVRSEEGTFTREMILARVTVFEGVACPAALAALFPSAAPMPRAAFLASLTHYLQDRSISFET